MKKQSLFKSFIRLLNSLIGKTNASKLMKSLLHKLPESYAFTGTWLTLSEIPLDESIMNQWQYGVHRSFPFTRLKVNPKCLAARFFVASGYYEQYLTKEILSPSRRGLLVDIGANYGYYSFLWLQKDDARVIAIEPVKEYVELLYENLQSYKQYIRIYPGCIGDHDGKALVDTCGDPTMLSRVVESNASKNIRQVEMLTLSSLMEKYCESYIDVLKIDAEGYDINILDSSKELFQEKRIRTVFWEQVGSQAEINLISFLENLGYQRILSKDAIGYEIL